MSSKSNSLDSARDTSSNSVAVGAVVGMVVGVAVFCAVLAGWYGYIKGKHLGDAPKLAFVNPAYDSTPTASPQSTEIGIYSDVPHDISSHASGPSDHRQSAIRNANYTNVGIDSVDGTYGGFDEDTSGAYGDYLDVAANPQNKEDTHGDDVTGFDEEEDI